MEQNKWQNGFLSSKNYLDDFKTICQYYTEKYNKLKFVLTFVNGLHAQHVKMYTLLQKAKTL